MIVRQRNTFRSCRPAVTLWATLVVIVATLGGTVALTRVADTACCRAELQLEADRAALQIGDALARQRGTGRLEFSDVSSSVRLGQWDATRRQFRPGGAGVNAVEVIARGAVADNSGHWLRRLFPSGKAEASTRAVATVQPRDIVFVLNLSGSMTGSTRAALEDVVVAAREDSKPAEDRELRLLYADLGFDEFPGPLEPFAAPWGVGEGAQAYRQLIAKDGPLSDEATNARYRIDPQDPVSVRRQKAYGAVIEQQVTRLMPRALPVPDSDRNYAYWAQYLDDVLASDDPQARIGYASYVRFMLDHGRNLLAGGRHVALSQHSDACGWHQEEIGGATFRFPPRTQPMHDIRRGLVGVLRDLGRMNRQIDPTLQRDRVAIITLDSLSTGGAWVEQPLTSDFAAASSKCVRLQAAGARAPKSTSLKGLQLADQLLNQASCEASQDRNAIQVVVLVNAGRVQEEKLLSAQVTEMAGRGRFVRVLCVGPETDRELAKSLTVLGGMPLAADGRNIGFDVVSRSQGSAESTLRATVATSSSAVLVE